MEYIRIDNHRTVQYGVVAILAVLLLCLAFAAPAQAATTRTVETSGYTWDAATGLLTITTDAGTTRWQTAIKDRSAVKHIVIASGVTAIRDRAFANTGVTDVAIADTVGYIGSNAFGNCASLQCISLPYAVTTVADNAFRGSGVCSITLGDTYRIPNWLEGMIETQYKRSGIVSYVLYVPTSAMADYEGAMALLAKESGIVISVEPVTSSPYASTLALTDADDAGYAAFNAGVAAQIASMPTDGVVTVTTDRYLSFDRQVYAALEARPDVEVVVHYSYHGTEHTCYIAPGTNMYFLYNGRTYVSFDYLQSKN